MKTVVIHQPDFIPYLGFFHRLLYADLFVILDDVQFLRRGWHHRDKIKTVNGDSWITVEVKKAHQQTKINQMLLNQSDWKQQHLKMLIYSYKKAKYFNEIYPFVEQCYAQNNDRLMDFNMTLIQMMMKLLDINVGIKYSSEYNLATTSNELLVDILRKVSATHYLSGIGAKDYFKSNPFDEAGISVVWQDFKHPIYPQLHGEFIPYLSTLDMLFNCGIEKSREILRGC